MIGKKLMIAFNILNVWKVEIYFSITKSVKKSYFFNDSKHGRMTLFCRKKVSALLGGIISKNNGDFFYLNCLHSFRTKKIKSHKKYGKIKIFVIL